MISGIYMINFSSDPDKIYIGSAVNIEKRWKLHLSTLKAGKHPNQKLQNYVNKYSLEGMEFAILLTCSKSSLLEWEQFYIDRLNPYFNICLAAGSRFGTKHSPGTRVKMSNTKKRNKSRRKRNPRNNQFE